MTKKILFYKIDILIKSSYVLVECIFTTLPKFSLTQTETPHSFSKKDKILFFHKNYIFQQNIPLHTLKQKTTNQQKSCRQKAENFLHLVSKRQKTYRFLKTLIFLQIAPMDTFNQFLTKLPEVCRQKSKKFWWLSEFPPKFFFLKIVPMDTWNAVFTLPPELPRETAKQFQL